LFRLGGIVFPPTLGCPGGKTGTATAPKKTPIRGFAKKKGPISYKKHGAGAGDG